MVTSLEARGVAHDYPGGVRALAGVDLGFGERELTALIGPNGSGKSTLLRILGGIAAPTRGEVALRGRSIRLLGARVRARELASVPQVLRALPESDVLSFVLGGRYAHLGFLGRTSARDLEVARRALAEVDGLAWLARSLAELSGGEGRRVLVARALAQESPILLFDEPTASLDPGHAVQLFELVRALVDAGRTAVIATHELALAARYADRVVLLDRGRVAAEGRAEDVLVPARLEPVYGPSLHYGTVEEEGRVFPVVHPWPAPAARTRPRR
jgi:iron complex transport system ATP-binding protein